MAGSDGQSAAQYSLRWFEEAAKEYQSLDGSQKAIIDKGLQRIQRDGPEAGEGLHGKLAGCRKIKNKKAGLRIVFCVSAQSIAIVEIIAVGKREDRVVYQDAETRIH